MATSGIESVVRIWRPSPIEDGKLGNDSVEEIEDAASSNQKRMTASPGSFLNLFLNMGYRLDAENDALEEAQNEGSLQCNSS